MYHSGLNLKQKVVIWIGLALVAQIGIYPPWIQEYSYNGEIYLGPTATIHYWIFSPPGPPTWVWTKQDETLKAPQLWNVRLDVARLMAEWRAIILVFGGLAWTLRDPRKPVP